MPRIIVKAGYFKNGKNNPHGEKYLEYIATRQGVDILDSSSLAKPATASQKKFIKKILLLCSYAKQLDEYLD